MANEATKVRNGVYKLKSSSFKDKNLILIHGLNGDGAFNTDADQFKPFYDHIKEFNELDNYNVWTLVYDTWWTPFLYSGSWLYEELIRITDHKFSDAIVVGYSMGGLIARTLTSLGFNYKYLITIDTPHLGPTTGLNLLMGALPGFTLQELHL
jgi:pimeloyl-ACP methyl ester carboxylesterase